MTTSDPAYAPRTTTDAEQVLGLVRGLRDERDEARQVVRIHERDLADLRHRIERTIEYVRVVRQHVHDPNARDAFAAIVTGLTTPVAKTDPGASNLRSA